MGRPGPGSVPLETGTESQSAQRGGKKVRLASDERKVKRKNGQQAPPADRTVSPASASHPQQVLVKCQLTPQRA